MSADNADNNLRHHTGQKLHSITLHQLPITTHCVSTSRRKVAPGEYEGDGEAAAAGVADGDSTAMPHRAIVDVMSL